MSAEITVHVRGSNRAGRPLLLLLHGFGSHEHDLPAIAGHLPPVWDWASLRAPLAAGNGGFSWVPIEVPGRPDPQVVADSTAAVLAWLDVNVEPGTVVVPVGFSQGGLMVTQLLRAAPERFAAGVVLSGFVLDAVLPGDEALAARRPPVFFGHGDTDQVISPDATARTSAWLPQFTDATEVVYPGLPHSISAEELADVSTFLEKVLPDGATGR
ncbi:alpha/beta hydrolase [Oerskovia enterophila]|uniref:Putative hydrolase n=1 Tax=Oerskovia enterophila TaxID=43678 RepID=A0A163T787_9CELL|nr:dienelactone hydrolase family protein [Oerskovia enterophila]KZM37189.1 putative hydrolase [Oerskovia enterophila]